MLWPLAKASAAVRSSRDAAGPLVIVAPPSLCRVTLPCAIRRLEWAATSAALPPHPPTSTLDSGGSSWLEVELCEGMNRQVRRMTAAVGYPCLRLIRYRVGPHSLDGLQPGDWRDGI